MGARRRRGGRRRGSYDVSRGIYVLPNLFTSGSVLCGFWSLITASQGRFVWAAWLILSCHVFDALDGRIARLTNTTSRFGAQYDSLADVIGFGVAPSFLVYQWAFIDQGRWGWLFAFFFVAAGAVRLARFNAQIDEVDPSRFVGLPIPVAATIVASTVLLTDELGISPHGLLAPVLLLELLVLSTLMVSTVPYRSGKDLNLRSRKPVWMLLPLLFALMLLVAEPPKTLFVVFTAYALSGPVEGLLALRSGVPPSASAERHGLSVVEGRKAGAGAPRSAGGKGA